LLRLLKNSICEASRSEERGVLFCTPQCRSFVANEADEDFWQLLLLRLLKKLHMRGVEEQGTRRTFLYAAVPRDDDNEADGDFSAA